MLEFKAPTEADLPAIKKRAARVLADLPSVQADDLPWKATRFPGYEVKPLGARKGESFVALGRMAPGGRNFPHAHGFHQVRYVLEGEFIINGKVYGPGSLIDYPEFARYETLSPNGATWLQVQFWDPRSGEGPTDYQGFTYGDEEDAKMEVT